MYEMGQREIDAVARVIRSGKLFRSFGDKKGPSDRFEAALAEKVGVRYALTTASGTTAMTCGLVGLGLGPGDEVIVPAYTFMATALAVLAVGAIPIIAEIDETLCIDPTDVERKITRHTKAVIPVHMIGRPCNLRAIRRVARKRKLLICEDACQAVGGSYGGKRLGSWGEVGIFSFNFYKNIACGEGGAILTDRQRIYERALIMQEGNVALYAENTRPDEPIFAGNKFRVSEIQGAILGEQLKRLDPILTRLRKRRAAMKAVLARASQFQLSPGNDEAGDCGSGICLLFETVADALGFRRRHKVGFRPIETGKHVYTEWEPVLQKRGSHHPKLNPYNWAKRKIEYSKDMCARSLDIMARTVNVPVPFRATVAEARALARRLLG